MTEIASTQIASPAPITTGLHEGILSVLVPMQRSHAADKGRQLLITPAARSIATVRRVPNPKLVAALAKAYYYQKLLDTGKYPNARALAKRYGSSVDWLLQLNLLAPNVKKAILDGAQPRAINLQMLKKPFPDDWQKQMRYFDFH